MNDNTTILVLMISAPLISIWGICAGLEAVASRTYWLVAITFIMSAFAGLCVGKLLWGVG